MNPWHPFGPRPDEETSLAPGQAHAWLPPPCDNARLIETWWKSKRSPKTQADYLRDAARFLACIGDKPLNHVSLDDLLTYQASLAHLKPASVARRLSAIKSLLSFGSRVSPQFFPINVGAALQAPRGKETLAERILEEDMVIDILNEQRAAHDDPYRERNLVLLRLLYKTAIRRNELHLLSWRDVKDREHGQGQITVFGKGGKTRTILMEDVKLYQALKALRNGANETAPVFTSRKHNGAGVKRLSPSQIYRVVRKAAERAGMKKAPGEGPHVSPHWLRHAHASHALDHGAPITLVRDTGGWANLSTLSRYSHARPNASSGKFLKG